MNLVTTTTSLPALDALVASQPRFQVDGTGPVSQRTITPATPAATRLLESAPAARDALRGVLRLVEHAAGGAAASSNVEFNGVSLATSPEGLSANTYRAHRDDDPIFQAAIARLPAADRPAAVAGMAASKVRESAGMLANVAAGWMNVGPAASTALLAAVGAAPPGVRVPQQQLADAVHVLLHESTHVIDTEPANLPPLAMHGVWEALAEARSTKLPQLQAARRVLGLDAVVSDAGLQASARHRPYAQAERILDGVLRTAGIEPGSAAAERVTSSTGHDAVETLVAKMAATTGESPNTARQAIGAAFAEAMG